MPLGIGEFNKIHKFVEENVTPTVEDGSNKVEIPIGYFAVYVGANTHLARKVKDLENVEFEPEPMKLARKLGRTVESLRDDGCERIFIRAYVRSGDKPPTAYDSYLALPGSGAGAEEEGGSGGLAAQLVKSNAQLLAWGKEGWDLFRHEAEQKFDMQVAAADRVLELTDQNANSNQVAQAIAGVGAAVAPHIPAMIEVGMAAIAFLAAQRGVELPGFANEPIPVPAADAPTDGVPAPGPTAKPVSDEEEAIAALDRVERAMYDLAPLYLRSPPAVQAVIKARILTLVSAARAAGFV